MILVLVLLIGLNLRALVGTIGSGAIAVGVVFVSLSVVAGYLLGGPVPASRSVLGLGTGQRNVAAALIIATERFPDAPGVEVMLLVTTLAGLVPLVTLARWSARRKSGLAEAAGRGETAPVPVHAGETSGEAAR
jgi:BASS family bile acid:Na+ symporter